MTKRASFMGQPSNGRNRGRPFEKAAPRPRDLGKKLAERKITSGIPRYVVVIARNEYRGLTQAIFKDGKFDSVGESFTAVYRELSLIRSVVGYVSLSSFVIFHTPFFAFYRFASLFARVRIHFPIPAFRSKFKSI